MYTRPLYTSSFQHFSQHKKVETTLQEAPNKVRHKTLKETSAQDCASGPKRLAEFVRTKGFAVFCPKLKHRFADDALNAVREKKMTPLQPAHYYPEAGQVPACFWGLNHAATAMMM
jgi:hypothetical protein